MLVLRGRIAIDRPVGRWVRAALARPGVRVLELGPEAAVAAALLDRDGFVGDRADRLIYASARQQGAALVTRDRRLLDFDPRGTVW